MDYNKIYNDLISRGKNRFLDSYTETHHIIPKCIGGSDDNENLVRLTPEEHYLAHQLLVKIYPKNMLLINAAMMMIPNRPSNKLYGWVRRRHSNAMSKLQSGNGNSQYGTRWIHNKDLRISRKIPDTSDLPDGWNEGRILDFDKHLNLLNAKIERVDKDKKIVKEIMYYYRDNNISMRDLARKFDVGHNIYKRFERYFKEEYSEIVKNKKGNSNVAKGRYKDL